MNGMVMVWQNNIKKCYNFQVQSYVFSYFKQTKKKKQHKKHYKKN